MGALLQAKLMQQVTRSLRATAQKKYHWCDSQVVLCWIKSQPNILQQFVANRVSQIQTMTEGHEWRYVKSKENPSVLASRGLLPSKLIQSTRWFNGPQWLQETPDAWPQVEQFKIPNDLPEVKNKAAVLFTQSTDKCIPFTKFSSYIRLQGVICYCLRFLKNGRHPRERTNGPLEVDELDAATRCLVRATQEYSFPQEIKCLFNNKPIPKSSKSLGLSPVLDEYNLIRVGGRLRNSNFLYDKKHPFLLDARHKLSEIIFLHKHKELLHAGAQQLLAATRETFCVINGRNLAKKIVRSCLVCFKCKPTQMQPIMGDLPEDRTKAVHPFYATGICKVFVYVL